MKASVAQVPGRVDKFNGGSRSRTIGGHSDGRTVAPAQTSRAVDAARAARLTRTARRVELHFTTDATALIAQALARKRSHRHRRSV